MYRKDKSTLCAFTGEFDTYDANELVLHNYVDLRRKMLKKVNKVGIELFQCLDTLRAYELMQSNYEVEKIEHITKQIGDLRTIAVCPNVGVVKEDTTRTAAIVLDSTHAVVIGSIWHGIVGCVDTDYIRSVSLDQKLLDLIDRLFIAGSSYGSTINSVCKDVCDAIRFCNGFYRILFVLQEDNGNVTVLHEFSNPVFNQKCTGIADCRIDSPVDAVYSGLQLEVFLSSEQCDIVNDALYYNNRREFNLDCQQDRLQDGIRYIFNHTLLSKVDIESVTSFAVMFSAFYVCSATVRGPLLSKGVVMMSPTCTEVRSTESDVVVQYDSTGKVMLVFVPRLPEYIEYNFIDDIRFFEDFIDVNGLFSVYGLSSSVLTPNVKFCVFVTDESNFFVYADKTCFGDFVGQYEHACDDIAVK